jgi:hypothetical protein
LNHSACAQQKYVLFKAPSKLEKTIWSDKKSTNHGNLFRRSISISACWYQFDCTLRYKVVSSPLLTAANIHLIAYLTYLANDEIHTASALQIHGWSEVENNETWSFSKNY